MVRCKFHLVLILFGLKSERTSWKSDGDFVVMLWLKKKCCLGLFQENLAGLREHVIAHFPFLTLF